MSHGNQKELSIERIGFAKALGCEWRRKRGPGCESTREGRVVGDAVQEKPHDLIVLGLKGH